jgi:hypothetical protein
VIGDGVGNEGGVIGDGVGDKGDVIGDSVGDEGGVIGDSVGDEEVGEDGRRGNSKISTTFEYPLLLL